MLKLDPEFGIYALSLRKAVKGLIQTGFTQGTDLDKILNESVCTTKADRHHKMYELHTPDVLWYRKVTPTTAPPLVRGFPQPLSGGFPAIKSDIKYYAIDGEDAPMNFETILLKYKYNRMTRKFVAICRKGVDGKLELTGFVF